MSRKRNQGKQGDSGMALPPGKRGAAVKTAIDRVLASHGQVTDQLLLAEIRRDSALRIAIPESLWNDAEAAEIARLEYCRRMILAARMVKILNQSRPPIRVRRLLISTPETYKIRDEVLDETTSRQNFVDFKKRQLESWCRESSDIPELAPIRTAIENWLYGKQKRAA